MSSTRSPDIDGRLAWHPASWRSVPAAQLPVYPDPDRLEDVMLRLARLPPLVTSGEVEACRARIARAQRGEEFLLQGGDCSERFADCTAERIAKHLKILLQMSLVLRHGFDKQVILVGRIAGQYAKPRSDASETRGEVTLPSYRGDLVNAPEFTASARTPDPEMLLQGYQYAALTLNFIRALADGGFTSLSHPEFWGLGTPGESPAEREFLRVVESMPRAFVETNAAFRQGRLESGGVDFYASHEGLHLPYEQAQTRYIPRRGRWYLLSAHLPWIGMRTCDPGGAHVEHFRGVANPIAIKVGPDMTPEHLLELLAVLDPDREPGRITLVHRFGADRVAECLPPLVEAVRRTGAPVLWSCDPMHGNTEVTAAGVKTRRFEKIATELRQSFEIHRELGGFLGGVHLELTGEDVTECTGGALGPTDADLSRAYLSHTDPRLNYEQALELVMLMVGRELG